ncbi:hypothetical protein, partial [Collinsella tanakaei]|uniref:hypothetical protein n=1 Tax=Collinsella tanakaei TaxID=626935 RepID=UPI002657DE1E
PLSWAYAGISPTETTEEPIFLLREDWLAYDGCCCHRGAYLKGLTCTKEVGDRIMSYSRLALGEIWR